MYFWNIAPLYFKLDRTPALNPFVNWADPAMTNQNHLILLSFGERSKTGGEAIILGRNPAKHCFY